MSRLLGHLTKQKRQKRKDVRGVKSSVSDAAELWITPNKQFCLQPSLECRQRWRRSDTGQQTVPHASRGHRKYAVTTVDRHVTGTTSVLVDAERRHRRASRSATHWKSLARWAVTAHPSMFRCVWTCCRSRVSWIYKEVMKLIGNQLLLLLLLLLPLLLILQLMVRLLTFVWNF